MDSLESTHDAMIRTFSAPQVIKYDTRSGQDPNCGGSGFNKSPPISENISPSLLASFSKPNESSRRNSSDLCNLWNFGDSTTHER